MSIVASGTVESVSSQAWKFYAYEPLDFNVVPIEDHELMYMHMCWTSGCYVRAISTVKDSSMRYELENDMPFDIFVDQQFFITPSGVV